MSPAKHVWNRIETTKAVGKKELVEILTVDPLREKLKVIYYEGNRKLLMMIRDLRTGRLSLKHLST